LKIAAASAAAATDLVWTGRKGKPTVNPATRDATRILPYRFAEKFIFCSFLLLRLAVMTG
jgi:hypothetical protein